MKKADAFWSAKDSLLRQFERMRGAYVSMPVVRASIYGYSNARVSSMKGLLLKKEMLLEMARMRSVDAVVEMLERTYYKDNLTKFSMRHHGSELVQVAGLKHFAQVAEKLRRITPSSDREAFEIMLMKWAIVNAKIVLHARYAGRKYEDVAPFLMPLGLLDQEDAKALFEGRGEALFMKFVRTRLGKQIVESGAVSSTEIEKLFLNMGSAELIRLETLLDTFYYSLYAGNPAFARKDLEPIAKIFAKEIDLKNASIIARLKQHGIGDAKTMEKYLIPGGQKKPGAFDAMISAQGAPEALKLAAKMFGLRSVPADAVELEAMLGRSLAQAKLDAFYRSELSVGVIFGFLFLKEEEINNIRKIAVGKEFGTPEKEIEGMLVFPA